MADQYFAVSEAITLATTQIFVLDVASTAGARRMNLNEMGVSFNGTSSSATPVLVRLVRTTTAPTANGTVTNLSTTVAGFQAATPLDPAAPSSTMTAYAPGASGWTTPPTFGVVLRSWYVPPTSGLVVQFPLGQEPDGPATTGAGLGIHVIPPAAVTVNSYMIWTE